MDCIWDRLKTLAFASSPKHIAEIILSVPTCTKIDDKKLSSLSDSIYRACSLIKETLQSNSYFYVFQILESIQLP